MQKYQKVYCDYFGYQIAEDVVSEVSGKIANDIHHVHGRGKGKDVIENLISLTREEHNGVHWHSKYTKAELTEIHLDFMRRNKK